MNLLLWLQKKPTGIGLLLLLLILACGPLNRLQESRRPEPEPATGAAPLVNNRQVITKAYEKITTLPGYRLESRHTIRDNDGNTISQVSISRYDAQGNRHTLIQEADGQPNEVYIIGGHTYIYQPEYKGWVDLNAPSSAGSQATGEAPRAGLGPVEYLEQLLAQVGARPTKAGPETIDNRPATRYELQPVAAETAEAAGQEPANAPLDLRGRLWVDTQTGALLKADIRLYRANASQPDQEYFLEITAIGSIAPIGPPQPVVDPAAIVAATATAQAQTILEAALNYRNEQINFEVIPLRVRQIPNSSPRSAEMQLILRQLPQRLFSEAELEPFLVQLREHLSLSIPRRNLIITSSGFRLQSDDVQQGSLDVLYFFNADLEDFHHVELILTRPGNPLFAPVPVE